MLQCMFAIHHTRHVHGDAYEFACIWPPALHRPTLRLKSTPPRPTRHGIIHHTHKCLLIKPETPSTLTLPPIPRPKRVMQILDTFTTRTPTLVHHFWYSLRRPHYNYNIYERRRFTSGAKVRAQGWPFAATIHTTALHQVQLPPPPAK